MLSKVTTTPDKTAREPVYWIEIIPAEVHEYNQRECSQSADGNCLNGTSTVYDGAMCAHFPGDLHEKIKQIELIPLTILILFTNAVVLMLIGTNKRFHTPTYTFIASLSVSDLFVGFVSIVTVATNDREQSENLCLARIGFTVTAITASVWSLTCIAVDRYIAVTRALRYRAIMTKRKTAIGIVWSWTVSIVIGFLPLIGWKDDAIPYTFYCSFMYVLPKYYIVFVFMVSAIVPLTTMFVLYGILFKSARFHIKRIQIVENLQHGTRTGGVFGISTRNFRSLKTFTAVLGCVVITWLPFIIATAVQIILIAKKCTLQDIIGTHLLVLGFSNSFLNPVIYALGTKDFRTKVRQVFGRRCYVLNSSRVLPMQDTPARSN